MQTSQGGKIMPEETTSAGSLRPAEPVERRIERLEQENRWWRGALIAVLAFVALVLLAGRHHRARIDVVVTVPPGLSEPSKGKGRLSRAKSYGQTAVRSGFSDNIRKA